MLGVVGARSFFFRNPRDTIVHGIQFRNGQTFKVI